ncbi:MAG TPA: hypothetical protein VGN78_12185, partial [Solirubrobacteraceae bacterium]|nr:hypothetical protein [Solirubrobacteraceae bacterium]
GRERRDAISAVIEQLHELRTRLEPKGRAVWFGVEVMGRARELGTLDDVLAISSQMCPATTKQAGIERVAAPRMPKGESCRAIFATWEAGRLPVVRGLVRAYGAQDRASGRSERWVCDVELDDSARCTTSRSSSSPSSTTREDRAATPGLSLRAADRRLQFGRNGAVTASECGMHRAGD